MHQMGLACTAWPHDQDRAVYAMLCTISLRVFSGDAVRDVPRAQRDAAHQLTTHRTLLRVAWR